MSIIFPEDTPIEDKDEFYAFIKAVRKHPVAAFQTLNRSLNDKGLCLTIMSLDEEISD